MTRIFFVENKLIFFSKKKRKFLVFFSGIRNFFSKILSNFLIENLLHFQRVDADEVKSRQEYLRAQRDKIVALKRRVRTEQLNANAERNGRPSSAQAAQRLLLSDTKLSDGPMAASLQLRKTLAKRLRNEVVDSKE